ncbi:hypothetical protein QBC35DRAFT_515476 [Podospora australis]|uniref:Transporter n=1 Tax=Podospora australis TaxID=1536484 RepID=A0AAN6WWC4_9PEZI|nr:hypothetical protein QBC35DRAFT_515476 [Podospora australis]
MCELKARRPPASSQNPDRESPSGGRQEIYSPVVLIVSLFLRVAYAFLYLLSTTLTSRSMRHTALRHLERRNGEVKPEAHLRSLVAVGLLIVLWLIDYGWSLGYRLYLIIPILSTSFCVVSILYFFLAVQTYLVEIYPMYAASGITASIVVRSIFVLTAPLTATHLFAKLGIGWGNTLLGVLAAVMVTPATLWLPKYGEGIRMTTRFMPKFSFRTVWWF